MAIELTAQQKAVVENRGGNLLVSAAAGSGKTRVLVERLMGYMEQGYDVDRFLIITFTNAAAAELRQRIASAIHARLALEPDNRNLRRNAALVYKAQICTIDAFCLDFLRQWGHMAGLDPDFRLCDQAESEELRAQTLEEVLEQRYAGIQKDAGFAALVDMLAGERDDQSLEEVILDIHRRIQAQADPCRWLLEHRSDYEVGEDQRPEDTVWGEYLLRDGVELVNYWLSVLSGVRDEVAADELLDKNYGGSLDGTISGLFALRDALAAGWDQAAACFPVEFPRVGTKRGDCDLELKERVKHLREQCKKQLTDLGECFDTSAQQVIGDLRAIAPAMVTLLEVTAQFDEAFRAKKLRRKLVEFSDCEQITARLLGDAELAADLGGRYVEIMVDEYQDTNAVQNTIFSALSNGYNLFMVGDVKQSIYRFRLADPGIFLKKYAQFADYLEAEAGMPRKILLSQNFRSRPEVLDATNFVFRNIMTQAAGELDYTEAEALRVGKENVEFDPAYQVELNCVDLRSSTDQEEEEKIPKDQIEARAAALRIRQLLDSGLMVGEHPVKPDDIVILLRSPSTVLRYYTGALDEQGVPWITEGGREFFGTSEISTAISLLQVIDNPRQDVPLLAVLRSPLFDFTPDQLAELRGRSDGCIYEALMEGAKTDQKCADFLNLLHEFRDLSMEEGSHRLIRAIYDRTDLTAVFSAMPDGAHRRANLMALYDEACRFESGGHRGLMAFLLHMTRMADNNIAVPVAGEEGSGVRILSIHKSKGLEFPVVVLCGLERGFNESDTRATILFHPELGLGPMRTDRTRMIRYTTIARDAVALRLQQQMRAEEMRLLYVAMTRAEHKLILFAGVNGSRSSLSSLMADVQYPAAPRRVSCASSMGEWVLMSALCRTDSHGLWESMDAAQPVWAENMGFEWKIQMLLGDDYRAAARGAADNLPQVGISLPDDLAEALGWRYGHMESVNIPSKLTATQLKGRRKDQEAAEHGVELRPESVKMNLRKPCFDEERPLTPTQRGTALHMVMQYLDFSDVGSREAVAAQIERMVERAFLTRQQGESVNADDIMAFFASAVGKRLLASQHMEKEFKFSILVPAREYYPEVGEEEQVLLQGVVDCWFRETDGSVTVVDFKTDRVSEETIHARAEDYRLQLEVYSRALGETLGRPVSRRVLWFFTLGQAVELA